MRVVVPTFQYEDKIESKTLAYIKRSDIEPIDVFILVADKGEYDRYIAKIDPYWHPCLRITAPGLVASRRIAQTKLLGHGEKVFWINDDVSSIVQKLHGEIPLEEVCSQGFVTADMVGARLWGIYPIANDLFMNFRVRHDLRHIVGCAYGEYNDPADDMIIKHGDYKEDYERSLRSFHKNGSVVRLDFLAPKTIYYNRTKGQHEGGRFENRTADNVAANVRGIMKDFPRNVKVNNRRANSPFVEILIR